MSSTQQSIRQPAAEIDGMEFFRDGATVGGAFLLNDVSRASAVEVVDSWKTEVRAGSRIVTVRGTGPESFQRAHALSIDAANMGLDMMSVGGVVDAWIREAYDQSIIWWVEGGRQIVRVVSIPTLSVRLGDVTVSGGTSSRQVPANWHESLRYFRLSQIADDLVDAYRNLYLALECILDMLAPQKLRSNGRPKEGEGEWFKRALGEAGQIVDLRPFLPSGTADLVQALWDELYGDVRSALFHAKSSRPTILPHGADRRREVAASLQRATSLYLALAKRLLNVRRSSSGIFAAFWRVQTDSFVDRLTLVATDDDEPVAADDQVVNPGGGRVVPLKTAAAPEFDRPFERAFLGSVEGDKIRELTKITRVCAVVEDAPLTAHIPEGDLRIDHVDRFETLVVLRAENARQPKHLYAS